MRPSATSDKGKKGGTKRTRRVLQAEQPFRERVFGAATRRFEARLVPVLALLPFCLELVGGCAMSRSWLLGGWGWLEPAPVRRRIAYARMAAQWELAVRHEALAS